MKLLLENRETFGLLLLIWALAELLENLLTINTFSFSLLWPTQDVHYGEECTRDFLFGVEENKQRSARLTAWFHTPGNYFIQVLGFLCCWEDDSRSNKSLFDRNSKNTSSSLHQEIFVLLLRSPLQPHVCFNIMSARSEFILTTHK